MTWIAAAPVQVPIPTALEAGYFQKYGIEPDATYIEGSAKGTAAMVGGSLDVAELGGEAVLAAQARGADLVIVGGLADTILVQLVSRPELNRPEDLKGKTIGLVQGGTSAQVGLLQALKRYGITRDDIKITYVGDNSAQLAALAAKQVDAAVMGSTFVNLGIKQGGKLLLDIAALHVPFINGPIVTRRAYLRDHRPEVVNFMKAEIDAVRRVKADKPFTEDVMRKHFKVDNQDVLDNSYEEASKYLVDDLYPKVDGVGAVMDLANLKDRRPEEFVDASVVDELRRTGFVKASS
jgi:ABC-type nitrate/sulfonate/bicarbonate transport system substrate-binding protein